MKYLLAGVLALLPAGVFAQELDCDAAMNQADMNQCAYQDFEEQDAALNTAYKAAIGVMKEIDSYQEAEDKGAEEALRAAQRAWIEYRDAFCAADGYRMKGGSAEPMLVSSCMARLSETQAANLQGLVEGY